MDHGYLWASVCLVGASYFMSRGAGVPVPNPTRRTTFKRSKWNSRDTGHNSRSVNFRKIFPADGTHLNVNRILKNYLGNRPLTPDSDVLIFVLVSRLGCGHGLLVDEVLAYPSQKLQAHRHLTISRQRGKPGSLQRGF